MNKSRIEWKVGLFVVIGLALVAVLSLQFSKGLTFFRPTYDILLSTPNVGELKAKASVLMSGVQVGTVTDIRLAPDGRTVTLVLRIFSKFVIHKDAKFLIEQSGFLSDQYVAIVPTENKLKPFEDGDTAQAEAPFNFQEFTRSAKGFMARVDDTIKSVNEALTNVSHILLNPETLTNLSATAANLRIVSDRAVTTIDSINTTITTNTPALSESASNLVFFSRQLNQFAAQLQEVVATNKDDIAHIVKNFEASSKSLKDLTADLQTGKGLAGTLLKNDELSAKASEIANNLSITTSNLNRVGLWRVLWGQKTRKTSSPPAPQRLDSPKAGR